MKIRPFLLDQWLQKAEGPESTIRWNLARSTGPSLTVQDVADLAGGSELLTELTRTPIVYAPAEGLPRLRRAIAQFEGVEASDVLVVNGASEALLIVMFAAAESGANVVLPHPDYPATSALAEGLGLEVRRYELRAEQQFQLAPEAAAALIDRHTRLVLVISPHNPTGATTSAEALRYLHAACVERGTQLVCDQVYRSIYYGDVLPSAAALPHATVIGDFSKALCLSGLRLGWIVERDPVRRAEYLNLREHFTISNNPLSEKIGVVAMERRTTVFERATRIASKNVDLLAALLNENADLFGWVRPTGGFTVFPWLRNMEDATAFCQQVEAKGVLVAPGSCFGAPAHFRIGFGQSAEHFGKGLEVFAAAVEQWSRAFA